MAYTIHKNNLVRLWYRCYCHTQIAAYYIRVVGFSFLSSKISVFYSIFFIYYFFYQVIIIIILFLKKYYFFILFHHTVRAAWNTIERREKQNTHRYIVTVEIVFVFPEHGRYCRQNFPTTAALGTERKTKAMR